VILHFCAILGTIDALVLAMLDWYSGLIGYNALDLPLNGLVKVSVDGELRWQSECRLKTKGSYKFSMLFGRGYC